MIICGTFDHYRLIASGKRKGMIIAWRSTIKLPVAGCLDGTKYVTTDHINFVWFKLVPSLINFASYSAVWYCYCYFPTIGQFVNEVFSTWIYFLIISLLECFNLFKFESGLQSHVSSLLVVLMPIFAIELLLWRWCIKFTSILDWRMRFEFRRSVLPTSRVFSKLGYTEVRNWRMP